MGISLRNIFSRAKAAPTTLRSWLAAKIDRTNAPQWRGATTDHINKFLSESLIDLQARCRLEMKRNPIVEGVVLSHVMDVVGPDGPTLQVQSENPDYNAAAERVWRNWWAMPDINMQDSGPDMLQQGVRGFWPDGEFIWQIVGDQGAQGPVKMRLNAIVSQQLATPMDRGGDLKVTLGVERDPLGRPLNYFIQSANDGAFSFWNFTYERVPARDIIHEFIPQEPKQARGVPIIAPSLQSTANVRDLDQYVIDAMKWAAHQSAVLEAKFPDAQQVAFTGTAEIERNQLNAVPPNYEMKQLTPTQPTANYLDVRDERNAEIGRPVGMPKMMVKLDASGHNYSSARFDGHGYWRMVKTVQSRLGRRVMNRLCDLALREAELEARATGAAELAPLRNRPTDVRYVWTWPVAPQIDQEKQANANKIALSTGETSLTTICAENGTDIEHVQAQRDREQRAFDKLMVERIGDLQKDIEIVNGKYPDLKLHWSHVLAIGGATTAPGAFLQGAAPLPDQSAANTPPKSGDNKPVQPNRMAPHVNGNGVHV